MSTDRETIRKLERRMDIRNPQLNTLYSEKTKTVDILTNIKTQIENLKNLNEPLKKLEGELKIIRSDIENIKSENMPLVAEVRILNSTNLELHQKWKNSKQRLVDIENEIKRLESEAEPIKQDIIKLVKQIEANKEGMAKLAPVRNHLEKLKGDMSVKFEEYKKIKDKYNDIKTLEKEKNEIEKYLEEVINSISEYELKNVWEQHLLEPLYRKSIEEEDEDIMGTKTQLYSKPKLYKKIGPAKKSRSKLSSISEEDGRKKYTRRSRSKKSKGRSRPKKSKGRSRSRK